MPLRLSATARRDLVVTGIAQTLAASCTLGQLWLLGRSIAAVFVGGQDLRAVAPLLAGGAALVLTRAVLVWGAEIMAQRASNTTRRALRQRLSTRLLQRGPNYTSTERSGTLLATATEQIEHLDAYVSQFLPARQLAMLLPLLVLLTILILDPLTSLVLLFAGPLLMLLLALIGQQTRVLTERRFAELRWMGAYFLDTLHGLPTLKLFGRSHEQAGNLQALGARYGAITMRVLRTAFQTSLVLEWGAAAATALVALEVSWRLLGNLISFEHALVVLLLTPEFFLPLRQLAQTYHAGTAGTSAARQIALVLATDAAPATHRTRAVPALQSSIRFEHVRLNDRPDGSPALDDCTLTIPHGQITAIVGPTGAGKSTLARLLLCFVSPTAGRITVDGVPLTELDLDAWRSCIAYVPQHPHLFAGTVADNICLGQPDCDPAAMIAAARLACIHDTICALPQGYQTPLGENGLRLSGGERQRIAIARAVLRNAPIMIFDEVTAHLDARNEAAIQEALATIMPGRTVLLIAHRLSMVRTATQIVVLDRGHVIASGDHASLMAESTLYRTMVEHTLERTR